MSSSLENINDIIKDKSRKVSKTELIALLVDFQDSCSSKRLEAAKELQSCLERNYFYLAENEEHKCQQYAIQIDTLQIVLQLLTHLEITEEERMDRGLI